MDVNVYIELSRQGNCLLQRVDGARGRVEVHEHDGLRWVYTGDDCILSMMRTTEPHRPVLPNHVAMLGAMLASGIPAQVLNLGAGTGAFERYFKSTLPAARVTSVDNDSVISEIAVTHFQLPADGVVHLLPAADYLAGCDAQYQLVLCDLFDGDRHPACIYRDDFYAMVQAVLAPGGVLAINLSPRTERELLEILVAMRRSLPHVILVNLERYGNVVLYASADPHPALQDMQHHATSLGRQLQLPLPSLLRQFSWLPEQGDHESQHDRLG